MNYLFLADHGSNEHPELVVHDFDANTELNDYEVSPAWTPPALPGHSRSDLLSSNYFLVTVSQIPWALRDLIAHEGVAHFFRGDFASLRNAFPDWHPKTAILRDIKRKLQPIQRINTNLSMESSHSKL